MNDARKLNDLVARLQKAGTKYLDCSEGHWRFYSHPEDFEVEDNKIYCLVCEKDVTLQVDDYKTDQLIDEALGK